MSIRTFDGNWIIAGDGIATSDDCCCDSSCASDSDCPSGQSCCDGVCQEEECGGECGCSLREGSSIVVTVDGNDVELSSPFPTDGEAVEVCSSGNEFLPDSYCESRFLSTADVIVFAGCHDDPYIWELGPAGDLIGDLPQEWPTSGIVVLVWRSWVSGSIYPECYGGSGGAARYFLYRMNCDSEGYPTTGELFYDSGTINEDGGSEYLCFDCTNQPSENRDCEQLSEPSSVSVAENPLP